VAVLHQDGLIVPVVSEARKEYAAGKQGDLEGLDVNVDSVLVPGVCSYSPGNDGGEDAVEVEQGEHGSFLGQLVNNMEEQRLKRLTEHRIQ
jgi:hypothetical protein